MTTKIAVPIGASVIDEVLTLVQLAVAEGAQIVEWRTDYLDKLTPAMVEKGIAGIQAVLRDQVQLLVTCRDVREGGCHDYDVKLRTDVLKKAITCSANYVDVEYVNYRRPEMKRDIDECLTSSGCRLILSAHEFAGCFDHLRSLYEDMQKLNPDTIAKLVYTPAHINDGFAALDLLHSERANDLIVLCMGEAGLMSRLLAPKLGGFLTFVSLDSDNATAPGQVTIQQYKTLYRPADMGRETEVYGVMADPVGHSMSPALHNVCFARAGLNKVYLPFLVKGDHDDVAGFLDNLLTRDWLHVRGLSVTLPHKAHALNYVHAHNGIIETLAEQIGAVNTLVKQDESRLYAYNTDYTGAMDAIYRGLGVTSSALKDKAAAVIGAGGVAGAIVAGLKDVGMRICIYNRTVGKAERLAEKFGCDYSGLEALTRLKADLLVNCTSIGMFPHIDGMPVPDEVLRDSMAVFDTIYNPLETRLLRQARNKGAKVIDGLSMFVGQALLQFRYFTGQEGDAHLMRQVVCEHLAG